MIMIVGQLGTVTGTDLEGASLAAELRAFVGALDEIHFGTLLLGLATLLFLFLARWRFPRAPAPLVAVLVATAVTMLLDLENSGIAVVGEIPAGLPLPSVPSLDSYAAL
jgi:MFS superfamily sulfate permease-like transporter